jgi:D-glycero-alpha-D-manno-heptose-7-phosphate kinase
MQNIDFRVPNRSMTLTQLKAASLDVRKKTLIMLGDAKSGHPGGSLSATEILIALYMCKMRHDPNNPNWEERDRFLLSKGHAAAALYTILSKCGYIKEDELKTYRQINSRLQGHAEITVPGVEIPSGPLGIGLSEGVGMALAAKHDGRKHRIYVLLGDGELNEGGVWEAAMSAAKFKLSNLVAIVDKNGLQQEGSTSEIMPIEPLVDKWKAFNWNVISVDGHNIVQVLSALDASEKSEMPTVIIANTVKGKGVDFMEGKVEYHGKIPGTVALQRSIYMSNANKSIIVSKTPMRITFVGGGTDTPDYYRSHGPGAVTNCAINKYIYIMIHKNFDGRIRVGYSKNENVGTVDEVKHPTVREALKLLDIDGGLDINSISDVPVYVGGRGLGSSSSFLVGVLNALHAWRGELASPKQLAEEAIKIEIDLLKEHGGKQDQYIAAFGGLRLFEFNKDDETLVRPIVMDPETKRKFKSHLMLLSTDKEHKSEEIHSKMSEEVKDHLKAYDRMRDLAYEMCELIENGKWHDIGKLMDENWRLKKTLTSAISNSEIDDAYERALKAGALGGKIIGSGGGGFFLFFANPEKHESVANALPEFKPVQFEFEPYGSRIISFED